MYAVNQWAGNGRCGASFPWAWVAQYSVANESGSCAQRRTNMLTSLCSSTRTHSDGPSGPQNSTQPRDSKISEEVNNFYSEGRSNFCKIHQYLTNDDEILKVFELLFLFTFWISFPYCSWARFFGFNQKELIISQQNKFTAGNSMCFYQLLL